MTTQLLHRHTAAPTATVVNVDPETARRWLDSNTRNRHIRARDVARYARDMAAGRWTFTGEAIKFATDGTLLDGQHRLHAVVKSGATVAMLVINNIAPEAQGDMDSGIKRQAADALQLAGYKNSTILSAAARLAMAVAVGRIMGTAAKSTSYSNGEIAEFVENNPTLVDATHVASQCKSKIDASPSVVAYCFWACSNVSVDDAAEFFEAIATTATSGKGDPKAALLQRLATARRRNEHLTQEVQVSLFLRAWNAWRTGQQVGLLKIDNGKGEPIPAPVAK